MTLDSCPICQGSDIRAVGKTDDGRVVSTCSACCATWGLCQNPKNSDETWIQLSVPEAGFQVRGFEGPLADTLLVLKEYHKDRQKMLQLSDMQEKADRN